MNKRRIITGVITIVVATVAVIGATTAYFSDSETSTGNIFQAGALDLLVDSEAHYNGLVCRQVDESGTYQWLEPVGTPQDNIPALEALEHYGQKCTGTWSERNLTQADRFFNFLDLKPGDFGENTISLHVYNNDAWGRFRVHNLVTADNTCTEPEAEAEGGPCKPLGDLQDHLVFSAWLDQGEEPGFQCEGVARCAEDPFEGDNVYQPEEGVKFWDEVTPAEGTWDISTVLSAAYTAGNCAVSGNPNGNTDYGLCHGLALDGRMVGSTTYYFGLAWSLPTSVGNIIQTDSLTADMSFDVVQWRNNPTKIGF